MFKGSPASALWPICDVDTWYIYDGHFTYLIYMYLYKAIIVSSQCFWQMLVILSIPHDSVVNLIKIWHDRDQEPAVFTFLAFSAMESLH